MPLNFLRIVANFKEFVSRIVSFMVETGLRSVIQRPQRCRCNDVTRSLRRPAISSIPRFRVDVGSQTTVCCRATGKYFTFTFPFLCGDIRDSRILRLCSLFLFFAVFSVGKLSVFEVEALLKSSQQILIEYF